MYVNIGFVAELYACLFLYQYRKHSLIHKIC